MQRAKPEALTEDVIPVLQVRVSENKLRQLFPIAMEDLDPLSEPEPSIGILIQLTSGELVVATYGLETDNLLLQVPKSKPAMSAIRAILEEIPIKAEDITWRADKMDKSQESMHERRK